MPEKAPKRAKMATENGKVKVTVLIQQGDATTYTNEFEFDGQEMVANMKFLIQQRSGINVGQMPLTYKDKTLTDWTNLTKEGVQNGETITLKGPAAAAPARAPVQAPPPIAATAASSSRPAAAPVPAASQPLFGANVQVPRGMPRDLAMTAAQYKIWIMGNEGALQQIIHNDPTLAQAIFSPDDTLLEAILKQKREEWQQKINAENARIAQLNADPFSREAQAAIAAEIEQGNIRNNMEQAMEHMPEAFGSVVMLYVPMVVQGTEVKAFVDSGAQTTIMSAGMAKKTGIWRLLDKRWAGTAKGVGTCKILGRVHMAQVEIAGLHLMCSFSVLEDESMPFLFGLDMLKRHQCMIDLKENVLHVRGGESKVPFLAEKDIPHLRARNREAAAQTLQKQGKSPEDVLMPTSPQKNEDDQKDNASSPVSNFPDESITQLMALGFNRDQAVRALTATSGNVDQAAQLLFGGMG